MRRRRVILWFLVILIFGFRIPPCLSVCRQNDDQMTNDLLCVTLTLFLFDIILPKSKNNSAIKLSPKAPAGHKKMSLLLAS